MDKKFRITFNAPVTLSFTMICFIVTLLGMLFGRKFTELFFMTYHSSFQDPLTYVRFITHIFGHDNWSHFISNASYLLLLGPMLEEKYGPKKIIQIMLIVALVTGGINYIFLPNSAIFGASGVVFSFILLASFTNFQEGEIPLTVILVAAIFMGQQIYEGIFIKNEISNMAHIVGGIIGAVTGYFLNKKSRIGKIDQ